MQESPLSCPLPSPGRGLISDACPDKPGLLQLPLPHRLQPFPTDHVHVSNKTFKQVRDSAVHVIQCTTSTTTGASIVETVQLHGPNTTEGCTAYVDYSALLGHLGEEV